MNDTIWIGILIVMGLLVAYTTARSSHKREAVLGGGLAHVTHYIAAGLLAMTAPTVICNVTFIHPDFLGEIYLGSFNLTVLVHALLIAFTMVIVALIVLLPYAMLEKPQRDALTHREEQGWTREDAETSGL